MPLHHMQLRRARKAAAGMEERATSWVASRKRLCRFSGLFNHRNSHCVQRDEETFAYFLLAAAIDGNRSTTGWVVVSPRRDLVRRRLPLARDDVVRARESSRQLNDNRRPVARRLQIEFIGGNWLLAVVHVHITSTCRALHSLGPKPRGETVFPLSSSSVSEKKNAIKSLDPKLSCAHAYPRSVKAFRIQFIKK